MVAPKFRNVAKLVKGPVQCIRPMTKTAAFNELGYNYASTRGVWTSEKVDGRTLITLWDQQIHRDPSGSLYVDLDVEHPQGDPHRQQLSRKPLHIKRAKRLENVKIGALKLDIVVLFGPVGDMKFATPWKPEEQLNKVWRVINVRQDDGFFRMEAS